MPHWFHYGIHEDAGWSLRGSVQQHFETTARTIGLRSPALRGVPKHSWVVGAIKSSVHGLIVWINAGYDGLRGVVLLAGESCEDPFEVLEKYLPDSRTCQTFAVAPLTLPWLTPQDPAVVPPSDQQRRTAELDVRTLCQARALCHGRRDLTLPYLSAVIQQFADSFPQTPWIYCTDDQPQAQLDQPEPTASEAKQDAAVEPPGITPPWRESVERLAQHQQLSNQRQDEMDRQLQEKEDRQEAIDQRLQQNERSLQRIEAQLVQLQRAANETTRSSTTGAIANAATHASGKQKTISLLGWIGLAALMNAVVTLLLLAAYHSLLPARVGTADLQKINDVQQDQSARQQRIEQAMQVLETRTLAQTASATAQMDEADRRLSATEQLGRTQEQRTGELARRIGLLEGQASRSPSVPQRRQVDEPRRQPESTPQPDEAQNPIDGDQHEP